MLRLFLVICSFMFGCLDPALRTGPYQRIHPELEPYYLEFLAEAKKRGVVLDTSALRSLSFVEDEGSIGRCVNSGDAYINKKKTDGDICVTRVVVFHELGHCILGLPHWDEPGRIHLMQSKLEPSCAIYLYLWDQLLDELFRPSNRIPGAVGRLDH